MHLRFTFDFIPNFIQQRTHMLLNLIDFSKYGKKISMKGTTQENNRASGGPGDLQARRRRRRQELKKAGITVGTEIPKAYDRYAGRTTAYAPEEKAASPSNSSSDNSTETQDFLMIPISSSPESETILLQSVPQLRPRISSQKSRLSQVAQRSTSPPQSRTPEVCEGFYRPYEIRPHVCNCPPIFYNGRQCHFEFKYTPPGSSKWDDLKSAVRRGFDTPLSAMKGKVTGFFEAREAKKREARRQALKKKISSPKGNVELEEKQSPKEEAKRKSPEMVDMGKQKPSIVRSLSTKITKMTNFVSSSEASSETKSPMRHQAHNASEMSFACIGVDFAESEPQPQPELQPVPQPDICDICHQAPAYINSGLCGVCARWHEEQAMKTDVKKAEEFISTDNHSPMKMDPRREKYVTKALRKLEGGSRTAHPYSRTYPTTKQTQRKDEKNYILPGTTYNPSEKQEAYWYAQPATKRAPREEKENHILPQTTYQLYHPPTEEKNNILPKTTYYPAAKEEEEEAYMNAQPSTNQAQREEEEENYILPKTTYQPCRPPTAQEEDQGGNEKEDETYILPATVYAPFSKFPTQEQKLQPFPIVRPKHQRRQRGENESPLHRDSHVRSHPPPPSRRLTSRTTSSLRSTSPSIPIALSIHSPPPPPSITAPRSQGYTSPPLLRPTTITTTTTYHDLAALDAAIAATEREGEEYLKRLPTYRIRTMSFEREVLEREHAEQLWREEVRERARRIPTMSFEWEVNQRRGTTAISEGGGGNGHGDDDDDDDEPETFFDSVLGFARRYSVHDEEEEEMKAARGRN